MGLLRSILPIMAAAVFAGHAMAGKISGRVTFDREVREALPKDASTSQRQRYRAANKVVIWVDNIKDAEPTSKRPQIVQGGSQFYPPLLIAVAGQKIDIVNNDNVIHGAYSDSRANTFDTGLKRKGEKAEVPLENPGLIRIGCPIHDEMSAKILIVPSSYHAVTDPGDPFVISDLPAGEYKVSAWQDGYKRATLTVLIPQNGNATANFELKAPKQEVADAASE